MKQILTILAVLCIFGTANAQFIETWEDATTYAQWTILDVDGDGYSWYIGDTSSNQCHSPINVIVSASYSIQALNPDNWLISPRVNIPNNAKLTFWVISQDPIYPDEHYGVLISTAENIENTDAYTFLLEDQVSTGTYNQITVDLSAYKGLDAYIAFRHYNCTDMFRINIDDIELTGDPAGPGDGISENDTHSFGLYPNPASEVININANDVKEIEIVNMLGQTVITTNVQTVNVANLTNGVYFVRVNFNNGTVSTQKFVKE